MYPMKCFCDVMYNGEYLDTLTKYCKQKRPFNLYT